MPPGKQQQQQPMKKQQPKKAKGKRKPRQRSNPVYVASTVQKQQAKTNVPIGSGAVTFASGAMPQSYISVSQCPHDASFTRANHNAKRIRFCVPFCRYGNSGSAGIASLTGSGALTVTGAAGNFQQAMAIGQPGCYIGDATYPLSTGYIATYLGLSQALYGEADMYTRFRYNRLRFRAIPSTATTASARSYWMSWVDDPLVATVAQYGTTASPKLSLTNAMNLPNAKLFPAWCAGELECSVDRTWKFNQQWVANGSSVSSAVYLQSLLRQMSPGALVMVCDYANAGTTIILDGLVWIEGEIDVVDPMYDVYAPATPSLGVAIPDSDQKSDENPGPRAIHVHRLGQRLGAAATAAPTAPPPSVGDIEDLVDVDASPRQRSREL